MLQLIKMKKLFLYVFLGLLFCNVSYAASSWFEIPNNDNTSNYWNLKKAEEIGPNKFKIPSVVIKTPERLEYEKFLIKKLVPYCGKAPGKYEVPSDFLIKGTPTLHTAKGMPISRSKGKGSVMYQIPYKKFNGTLSIICTTKIESYWKGDYSAAKEKSVIAENIRWNSEERVVPDYFDCRNKKIGIDLSGEPFWVPNPVKENTRGGFFLRTICEKLN